MALTDRRATIYPGTPSLPDGLHTGRLDRVETLYPGVRLPDGQNYHLAAKAHADLQTNLNIAAELGDQANFAADHGPEIAAAGRRNLVGMLRPLFDTRVIGVPYGDAVPSTWQPPVGVGWILEGVTVFAALDGTYAPVITGAMSIEGFDQIGRLILPMTTFSQHHDLHFRVQGTQQVTFRVIGTPPTLQFQPPLVVLQLENWGAGVPLGD